MNRIFMALAGLAVVAAAGLMTAGGAGCQGKADGQKKIKIGFLVKMPQELWFQNEWKHARRCAKDYGFQLLELGVPDNDKVLSAIDNLASQGAQGFVICTPEVRLGPAIVAAAEKYGMKVFAVDDQFLDANGQPMKDVPYMGIAAQDIGRQVGQALVDEFKKRAWDIQETAACGVTFDSLPTAKSRTDGAKAALIEKGFPAGKIHTTPEKDTDIEASQKATDALLTLHPEVKRWLVFSMNDEGVMGAVRAMEGRASPPRPRSPSGSAARPARRSSARRSPPGSSPPT